MGGCGRRRFGNERQSLESCDTPVGYAEQAGDCDDADPAVHPGAVDLCNEVDDDCSGAADDDPAQGPAYFPDGDGDGDFVSGFSAGIAIGVPGDTTGGTDAGAVYVFVPQL